MWKLANKLGLFVLLSAVLFQVLCKDNFRMNQILVKLYRPKKLNVDDSQIKSSFKDVKAWQKHVNDARNEFRENSTLSLSTSYSNANSNETVSKFTHKGEIKGDPHFSGFDGSHFDYTGHPGKYYCLISDKLVHLNAFFGGRYGQWGSNPHKPLTWIYKFALLWENHHLIMTARSGFSTEYGNGFVGSIEIDGTKIELTGEKDQLILLNGELEITWLEAMKPNGEEFKDVFQLSVANIIIIEVNVNPEISMLRTPEDAVVHFNLAFPVISFTDNVHGIIGQTHRPDRKHLLAKQKLVFNDHLQWNMVQGDDAEGFLDGKPSDYESSGILNADCKFNRFNPPKKSFI